MPDMKFGVFEGDGIGPEVTFSSHQLLTSVLTHIGVDHHIESMPLGFSSISFGDRSPDPDMIALAQSCDGLILGPVNFGNYPPSELGVLTPGAVLQRNLDLYATVCPVRTLRGITPDQIPPFDLALVHLNEPGYVMNESQGTVNEMMPTSDIAMAVRKITREGSSQVAQTAFEVAERRRQSLTVVHQTDLLPMTEGVFMESIQDLAPDYPTVRVNELRVEDAIGVLINSPQELDVIVTSNSIGRILTDLATGLSGTSGVIGKLLQGSSRIMVQTHHGSAPTIAGQGQANPSAVLFSCAHMLSTLGHRHRMESLMGAASAILDSLTGCLAQPTQRTAELGGPLSTHDFTDLVIAESLERLPAPQG